MEGSGVGSNCSVLLVRIVENFEGVGRRRNWRWRDTLPEHLRRLGSALGTDSAPAVALVIAQRIPFAGIDTASSSFPAVAGSARAGTESQLRGNVAAAAGRGSGGRIVVLGCGAGGIGGPRAQGFGSGVTGGDCSRRRGNGEVGRTPGRNCGRLGGE